MIMFLAPAFVVRAQVVPDADTGITPVLIDGRMDGFSGLGNRSGRIFEHSGGDARTVAMGSAASAVMEGVGALYQNHGRSRFCQFQRIHVLDNRSDRGFQA